MTSARGFTTDKGQPGRVKTWQAALYVRLSREDGDKEESDSITNQRDLLLQFAELESDIEIYDVYIDDGWSGTSFDRPDFQRMLSDIKAHHVNCVMVKDLSRFGRNYIDVGQYIENIFPLMDIRFISISDHLDSVKNPQAMNTIMVPFKNLINDEYCRDISNKVRSSLDMKRKQGKHIGSFACYGYLKDPDDHNRIIPDPVAGEVVKDIFRWFIAGHSIIGIAKKLNMAGIPNPTAYKQQLGFNYRHPKGGMNDGLWPDSSVRRILLNRMYTGAMVQGVNKVKSYKVHVAQRQPEEKWIVIEGTHEALITQQDYDAVQSILRRRTRTAPQQERVHLFSGYLRCADCGKAMNRKLISQPYATYCYYVCSTFKKMDRGACTKHTIRSDRLEEMVLATVQSQVALAIDMEKAIESINQSETVNREAHQLRNALGKARQDAASAESMALDLYPDWKAGLITRDEYTKLKARFEKQTEDAKARIASLEARIAEAEKGQNGNNAFLANFVKFRNIQTLTREVLVALVDTIYIYEGGDIKIDFKYQDPFKAAFEYIENNRALLTERENGSLRTA